MKYLAISAAVVVAADDDGDDEELACVILEKIVVVDVDAAVVVVDAFGRQLKAQIDRPNCCCCHLIVAKLQRAKADNQPPTKTTTTTGALAFDLLRLGQSWRQCNKAKVEALQDLQPPPNNKATDAKVRKDSKYLASLLLQQLPLQIQKPTMTIDCTQVACLQQADDEVF